MKNREEMEERLTRSFIDAPRLRVANTELRPAAVLVALVWEGGGPDVLLTRRTDDVETHKGQYALPGGVTDEGDRDPVHTALREAEEELGIAQGLVHPITLLDDLETPTGFLVTPVVATLAARPPLIPNPTEVAEAFWMPLRFFAGREHRRSEQRVFKGVQRELWFYDYEGRVIWGATAWVLRRLVWRLGVLEEDVGPGTPAW